MSKRYQSNNQSNRNAIIVNRIDRTGKSRTETQRRDNDAIKMAVSTDPSTNSTSLFVDFPGWEGSFSMNGHNARSLYRLLRKHYGANGKSRTA